MYIVFFYCFNLYSYAGRASFSAKRETRAWPHQTIMNQVTNIKEKKDNRYNKINSSRAQKNWWWCNLMAQGTRMQKRIALFRGRFFALSHFYCLIIHLMGICCWHRTYSNLFHVLRWLKAALRRAAGADGYKVNIQLGYFTYHEYDECVCGMAAIGMIAIKSKWISLLALSKHTSSKLNRVISPHTASSEYFYDNFFDKERQFRRVYTSHAKYILLCMRTINIYLFLVCEFSYALFNNNNNNKKKNVTVCRRLFRQ